MGSHRSFADEYDTEAGPLRQRFPSFLADTRLHLLLVVAALLALLVSTGRSATQTPRISDHAAHCRVCDHSKPRAKRGRKSFRKNILRQYSVVNSNAAFPAIWPNISARGTNE